MRKHYSKWPTLGIPVDMRGRRVATRLAPAFMIRERMNNLSRKLSEILKDIEDIGIDCEATHWMPISEIVETIRRGQE